MAITSQHEKGEPTEADLTHAYGKARKIGLFLVEKYARQALRDNASTGAQEFVMAMGVYSFWDVNGERMGCMFDTAAESLDQLMMDWGGNLKLTGEPMRFTADGPVRRDW
jgi:hypothetical protein